MYTEINLKLKNEKDEIVFSKPFNTDSSAEVISDVVNQIKEHYQLVGFDDYLPTDIVNDLIKYVRCEPCDSWEQVYANHARYLAEGYEGTILRNDTPYEWKRTDNLLKIKDMQSMDCIYSSINEGTGKAKGMMGSITVIQENGVECEVGTGFTDEMRKEFWDAGIMLAGRTVEIKYQELSPDGCMRFPVFIRMRPDKDD